MWEPANRVWEPGTRMWEPARRVWELKRDVWELSSHQLPLNLTPVLGHVVEVLLLNRLNKFFRLSIRALVAKI